MIVRMLKSAVGAFMDVLSGIGLTEDTVKVFATGVGAGALLCAVIVASLRKQSETRILAKRVGKLEMRLAAGKDFTSIASAMEIFQASLPVMTSPEVVTLFSTADIAHRRPTHRTDPEQVAREFAEAMRDNTVAAVEIAKAIIDQGVNLNDAKDRRKVSTSIKKLGQALNTTFWDHYGEVMLASNLPSNLKDLLKVFFAQVKRLKAAVLELAKEPTFADLDTLLDRAIDLLDTAKAIIDELEHRSGA